MKIYVVVGESGVYDDYRQWNVKAFTSEVTAKNCISLLTAQSYILHNFLDERDIGSYNACNLTVNELDDLSSRGYLQLDKKLTSYMSYDLEYSVQELDLEN